MNISKNSSTGSIHTNRSTFRRAFAKIRNILNVGSSKKEDQKITQQIQMIDKTIHQLDAQVRIFNAQKKLGNQGSKLSPQRQETLLKLLSVAKTLKETQSGQCKNFDLLNKRNQKISQLEKRFSQDEFSQISTQLMPKDHYKSTSGNYFADQMAQTKDVAAISSSRIMTQHLSSQGSLARQNSHLQQLSDLNDRMQRLQEN